MHIIFIFTNLMHHTIQLHWVHSFYSTLDKNTKTFNEKLQFLTLNYACKYNALLAFECSDIALNFFKPEKFLSSAATIKMTAQKGVANLPLDENIKTYPLSSLYYCYSML